MNVRTKRFATFLALALGILSLPIIAAQQDDRDDPRSGERTR